MSDDWALVGRVDELDLESKLQQVEAFGELICLGKTASGVFAVHDVCTHGYACLSEGWVEGNTVVCPLHQGSFDVCSGEPVESPAIEPLRTFAVRVDNGLLYVKPKGD